MVQNTHPTRPDPDCVYHSFSGFGPRNAMLFKGVVLNFLAERETLRKLGMHMKFDVFEMQSEVNASSGNAFQVDCDATINTGIPGRVPSQATTLDRVPSEYQHIVAAAGDLASFATQELAPAADKHRDELRKRNPAAYALFIQSLREDNSIDVSLPCTTRGTVGKIHRDSIKKVLDFVVKEVPEIQIEFHYEHTVVDADFTLPTKPKLLVCRNGDREAKLYSFDFVHLANGTTWKVPVSESVAPKAFSETPSLESIGRFLSQQGLLDEHRLLRPNTKLRMGITGMSLSAYDPVAIILQYTKMIYTTDRGYEIDEDVASQYQGLLTFISRSKGKVAPPRHRFTRAWPGKKVPDNQSFMDTYQAHAMFLQKNFDWLSFARELLYQ
ncbi:hypothetical protein CONPUDRAFT_166564, partial [Coniophora puteana RWD-64-598 SS2]